MEKCSQNSKVELVARPRLAKFIKKKNTYTNIHTDKIKLVRRREFSTFESRAED